MEVQCLNCTLGTEQWNVQWSSVPLLPAEAATTGWGSTMLRLNADVLEWGTTYNISVNGMFLPFGLFIVRYSIRH